MHPIRIILHLTGTNLRQLKRKWRSLSLLLPFPLLLITLLSFLAIQMMTPEQKSPIEVGLVGLDQSKESRMIVTMLQNNKDFKNALHVNELSHRDAEKWMDSGKLAAYIAFPEAFSRKLYCGEPITLQITGSPDKRRDAEIIATFMNSAAKHINSAQANILNIGAYAEEAGMPASDVQTLLKSEFRKYIFFTLAKDQALHEEVVTDDAAANTVLYYVLSGIFASWIIWFLLLWHFFQNDDSSRMTDRIRLYGVRQGETAVARIVTVLLAAMPLAAAILLVLPIRFNTDLVPYDLMLALINYLLVGISFLFTLGIIDSLISSKKMQLLLSAILAALLLIMSGTIIPLSFFPEMAEKAGGFFFAASGFNNLLAMAMPGSETFTIRILLPSAIILGILLFIITSRKERSA